MRPFLEKRGIEVIETDLGERIQQLDNEPPSHIVVPAVHKLRTDVAEVFANTIGTDPANSDVHYLAESQREHTRPLFLQGRRRHDRRQLRRRRDRHASSSAPTRATPTCRANLPKLHIASIGIEKMIPRIEHLGVFVRMLSRSALGSPITQIHLALPRRRGRAARCTSCWSTTAAPSGSAWTSSGTRSSASAAAPA